MSTGLAPDRPQLGLEPGAHRARGGHDRLVSPDARALGSAWSGVIQDTASTASLVALLVRARARYSDHSAARGGLQARAAAAGRLLIRAQPQLDRESRAARGVRPREPAPDRRPTRPCPARGCAAGSDRARTWPRDESRPRSSRPSARRRRPRIDPVGAMASLAAEHGLWLHVDAALAGSAMILPECRALWARHRGRGFDRDQSAQVARRGFRLLAPTTCAIPAHLVRVMSTNPSYLRTAADGEAKNLPRLGHSARPAFPRAQALVPDPRAGRRGLAGAPATRSRQCAVAQGTGRCDAAAGGGSHRCRCKPFACATSRRVSKAKRSTAYARAGAAASTLRAGLAHARAAPRALDGASLDRRGSDGARARAGAVAADAGMRSSDDFQV